MHLQVLRKNKIMMRRLTTADADFDAQLKLLLEVSEADTSAIEQTVAKILREVQESGDEAVLRLTQQFDRLQVASIADLELSKQEMQQAFKEQVTPDWASKFLMDAIQHIEDNRQKAELDALNKKVADLVELGCIESNITDIISNIHIIDNTPYK